MTLLDLRIEQVLPHGSSKRLIEKILWHTPKLGSIGAYTPSPEDVKDHFGIFRGADQIECLAQASVVPLLAYNESNKLNLSFEEYFKEFVILGAGVGKVVMHHFLKEGEQFVALGKISFYRFRQMIVDGKIFKVPESINLQHYFSTYPSEDFEKLQLDPDFTLVSDFKDLVGRAMRRSQLI